MDMLLTPIAYKHMPSAKIYVNHPLFAYNQVTGLGWYWSLTHWRRDKMAAILADDTFKYKFVNENILISIKKFTEACS